MNHITFTHEDAEGWEHEEPAARHVGDLRHVPRQRLALARHRRDHERGVGPGLENSNKIFPAYSSSDEQEDYLAGRYDRQCEACKGTGKVLVVDEKHADAALLAIYYKRGDR